MFRKIQRDDLWYPDIYGKPMTFGPLSVREVVYSRYYHRVFTRGPGLNLAAFKAWRDGEITKAEYELSERKSHYDYLIELDMGEHVKPKARRYIYMYVVTWEYLKGSALGHIEIREPIKKQKARKKK